MEGSNLLSENSSAAHVLMCNICLVPPTDPVLTTCGHLFCWPCLHRWFGHVRRDSHGEDACPSCRRELREDIDIVPVYGSQGDAVSSTSTDIANDFSPRPTAPFSSQPIQDLEEDKAILESEYTRLEAEKERLERDNKRLLSKVEFYRFSLNPVQLDLSELRLRYVNMAEKLAETTRQLSEERNRMAGQLEERTRQHLEETNRMKQEIERLQGMLAGPGTHQRL